MILMSVFISIFMKKYKTMKRIRRKIVILFIRTMERNGKNLITQYGKLGEML
jgi:hypothetical protein